MKIKSIIARGATVLLETLLVTEDENQAFDYERILIKNYGRRIDGSGILTNHTLGGEGPSGYVHTEASRVAMSVAKKGNKINLGRVRSDMVETFSKTVSQYDTSGLRLNTFSSAREASASTGVAFGQISECCLGRISRTRWSGGWTRFSFEIIDQIEPLAWSTKRSRPIGRFDSKSGKLIDKFRDAAQAEEMTGVWASAIRRCAHGHQITAGGYCWKFV